MYSRDHALLSFALAVMIVLVTPAPVHPAAVAAVVLVVGVGIDLDHFVLALANTGSSAPIRRVLERPVIVLVDQDAIFDDHHLTARQRLVSHVVIGGIAVAGLWFVAPYWALVVGLAVAVHVAADVYHDATHAT